GVGIVHKQEKVGQTLSGKPPAPGGFPDPLAPIPECPDHPAARPAQGRIGRLVEGEPVAIGVVEVDSRADDIVVRTRESDPAGRQFLTPTPEVVDEERDVDRAVSVYVQNDIEIRCAEEAERDVPGWERDG